LPDVPSLLRRLALSQQRPDLRALQMLQSCLERLLRLRALFEQHLAPGLMAGGGGAGGGMEGGGGWSDAAPTPSSSSSYSRLNSRGRPEGPMGQRSAATAAAAGGGGLSWEAVSISAKVLTHVGAELQGALDLLLNMIDTGQSEEGLLVAPGVCPPLDALKATHRDLPQQLTAVVRAELGRVPRCLIRQHAQQLWSVVYLPQVGFVLRVQGEQLTADVLDALPDYE
ncbi:hypothetical protein Agub_g10502, partial [Astrephomene gubernaculifera]